MSSKNWTKEQEQAIYAPVGNLLVSAAAGSGKTTVLVERIVQRITGENHTDIDRLLVVTFTKAAAAEMKHRLSVRLSKMLKDNPDDSNLKRQLVLLEKAHIGTMDSYFSDLVKSNFHALEKYGVTLDYTIMPDSDFKVISDNIVSEILEKYYSQADETFARLVSCLTSDRDDGEIKSLLEQVHHFTSSIYAWQGVVKNWSTKYSDYLLPQLQEKLLSLVKGDVEYACKCYEELINLSQTATEFSDKFTGFLQIESQQFTDLLELVKAGDYEQALLASLSLSFDRAPTAPKEFDELKNQIKNTRDYIKKVAGRIQSKLYITTADSNYDSDYFKPVVQLLTELIFEYEEKLLEHKKERASFQFSDIANFAMSLLVDDSGTVTDFARELSNQFDEVYIDECQDTNSIQNLFFDIISKDHKNIFIVGDAKQSIYRFRQAEPKLFIDNMEQLPPYTEQGGGYILLKENFRSTSGILEFVNLIFEGAMSKACGDIDYDDSQKLVAGKPDVENSVVPVEVHCVPNYSKKTGEKASHFEQRYLASVVKNLVEGKERIADPDTGEQRKIKYSDICVLLRGYSKMGDYISAFKNAGIDTFSPAAEGFYSTKEIKFAVNFLRSVDNPLRDIELLSLLYSPLFGFSPDDLALIKTTGAGDSLYAKLITCAEKGNDKCQKFLETFERVKTYALSHTPSELLEYFYYDLGYYALAGAGGDGSQAQANLVLFLDHVIGFQGSGFSSLSTLLRYIDRVIKTSDRERCAYTAEASNKVTFMTIHSSKGLQFPVVILADCSRKFNTPTGRVILSKDIGIGLKYRDETFGYFNTTLPYQLGKYLETSDEVSEELRLLYVALTRAEQKLIVQGSVSGSGVKSAACAEVCGRFSENYFNNCTNYMQWIQAVLLHHPSAGALRDYLDYPVSVHTNSSRKIKVVVPEYFVEEQVQKSEKPAPVNEQQLKELRDKFQYKYPYSDIFGTSAVASASGLNDESVAIDDWKLPEPAFLQGDKLVGASRGTAVHRFMQCANLFTLPEDYQQQVETLVAKGYLNEQQGQAVDSNSVTAFCNSEVYKLIAGADEFLREYRFSFLIPAGELNPELPASVSDEKVLIQGVADGVIVKGDTAIVLDYKTDKVKSASELVDRYSKQMSIYCKGISEVLGKKVEGCILYSFHLNEETEFNPL